MIRFLSGTGPRIPGPGVFDGCRTRSRRIGRNVALTGIKNVVHGDIAVGTVLTWMRQYTDGDVREFFELSGTPVDPLPEYLPFLLIIAPLTKLGGDLNYLSSRMEWAVTRPVLREERITAELEVTRLEPGEGRTKIGFTARLRCGEEVVVTGRSSGYIVGDQPVSLLCSEIFPGHMDNGRLRRYRRDFHLYHDARHHRRGHRQLRPARPEIWARII